MSGIRGRVHFDEPAPVRRWCEVCQDFTASVMIDGQELCENWEYPGHGYFDDDPVEVIE